MPRLDWYQLTIPTTKQISYIVYSITYISLSNVEALGIAFMWSFFSVVLDINLEKEVFYA